MQFTTRPVIGIAMSVLLLLAGWYMISAGEGTAAVFGWGFIGIGVLSGAVNVVLLLRDRR